MPRATERGRASGYLLAEALVALAVISLVAPGIAGILAATYRQTGRTTDRLEEERQITAAQITLLTLVREDSNRETYLDVLRRAYPTLEVSETREALTIAGSTSVIEIHLPRPERRR